MKFNIIKKNSFDNTNFRVQSIKNKFSLDINEVIEEFKGEIDLPEKWNIGVIVGASGTGKTTIKKELFGNDEIFDWGDKSIIETIAQDKTLVEIIDIFNKVGFNSPKSWLKNYNVLSNGEKMRVDLAREILSNKETIVFDEFTSVVDRQIAKVSSYCVSKYIRKNNKKFVAVSCHYDILDWLEPDWIFDTNSYSFILGTKSPNIKDLQLNLKLKNVRQNYGKDLGNIII